MHTSSKLSVSAQLVLLAFGLLHLGCANERGDEKGSMTAALVSDNNEIESLEGDLEGSLELALSGAASEDAELAATDASQAAETARTNVGLYLQPAGCVTSTREGSVVMHVLEACTGPRGRSLDGTIVSTWSRSDSGLSVVHEARGFSIEGALVDHDASIAYERLDGAYRRHRTSSTVGTTARGHVIDHSAEFATVYDATTACFERNGSSRTAIEERRWNREVTGLRRCGGRFDCPSSGSITFSGPNAEGSIEVTGAGVYDVTVNGRTDTNRRMLWCSAP